MNDTPKSAISAGRDLRALLLSSPLLSERLSGVFPIIADEAALPYIAYTCAGMSAAAVKDGRGPDRADFEVVIYSADYDDGAELAEAARAALTDPQCGQIWGGRVTNYRNGWAGDAYYHLLTVQLRTLPL